MCLNWNIDSTNKSYPRAIRPGDSIIFVRSRKCDIEIENGSIIRGHTIHSICSQA